MLPSSLLQAVGGKPYLNYVAGKFDLRKNIQFNSRVISAHFDDAASHWTVTLDNGEQTRAPLLITALGPLSAFTLPNIPGRDSFRGPAFHTARWPHEPVSLEGKRVGIVGTGATAIQNIHTIAKTVKHLTVFQRTPNWAAPLHNSKITDEEQTKIKASYPEIFERCRQTATCFVHASDPRKTLKVPPREREAFWEKLYSEPRFGIWAGNFLDILTDNEANAVISEFIARKIRQRVKDPKIPDKLIPKDRGFGTRRVPLETGYFEVYNQDYVVLVDINETPIERITPKGIVTSEKEYEFDLLIYATGFDGVTGPYDRIDIRGPGGRRLKDDWAEVPRTFLGVQAEGFPNMLMILGPHTARGNIPPALTAMSRAGRFAASLATTVVPSDTVVAKPWPRRATRSSCSVSPSVHLLPRDYAYGKCRRTIVAPRFEPVRIRSGSGNMPSEQ